jgi:predicted ATPase
MSLFFLSMRRRRDPEDFRAFPWGIPAIRTLAELKLRTSVTFLVGENGSGKSTLLEANFRLSPRLEPARMR